MLRVSLGVGGILAICLPTLAGSPLKSQSESQPKSQISELAPSYKPCQLMDVSTAGLFLEATDVPAQTASALCGASQSAVELTIPLSLPALPGPDWQEEGVLKASADEDILWSPEKRVPIFTDGASIARQVPAWRHLPQTRSAARLAAEYEVPNALYAPSEYAPSETSTADTISELLQDSPKTRALIEPAEFLEVEATAVAQSLDRELDQVQIREDSGQRDRQLDEELGILQVKPVRSRDTEELGILQLLQTAQARAPQPTPPIAFLTVRTGYFSSENIFRSDPSLSEEVYQTGLSFYLSPRLSDRTSLYVIAETNVVRYEKLSRVSYNDLGIQVGLRQRLFPRTFVQVGWRNQQLYSRGYRDKLFNINAIDALISHRSILSNKIWLDSFYQARWGFTSPSTGSRFRQTLTLSLNYGVTRNLRGSLIYQLDFDDYTQVPRFDTYHQLLGVVSYNVNETSRVSLFGGTRFGRSSVSEVSLEDTFYGAGLNVSLPLF